MFMYFYCNQLIFSISLSTITPDTMNRNFQTFFDNSLLSWLGYRQSHKHNSIERQMLLVKFQFD